MILCSCVHEGTSGQIRDRGLADFIFGVLLGPRLILFRSFSERFSAREKLLIAFAVRAVADAAPCWWRLLILHSFWVIFFRRQKKLQ